MAGLKWYLLNLLIALDQVGTALLGGYADETMSSYAHRMRVQRKPFGFLAGWIDWTARNLFADPDHCYRAFLRMIARTDVPPEFRRV